MEIRISGAQEMARFADLLGKQYGFAASLAINRTLQNIKVAELAEFQRALDRPTPYTLNGLYIQPANRKQQNIEGAVRFKDDLATSRAGTPPSVYLVPQVQGGSRFAKRFEKVLANAGVLPRGYITAPGPGANLDAYGNVSRGQLIQILSQLRITPLAGSNRNMSTQAGKAIAAQRKAGGRFFATPPGQRLAAGIWQREFMGRGIAPVLFFIPSATYQKRLDWEGVAQRTVAARLPEHFRGAINQALATARP